MSDLYLDGGGPKEREAFLPRMYRQSGFPGSMEEYRARVASLARHPYVARAIRELVLRNGQARAIAGLRLTAIPALHGDREIWIGGISHLVTHADPPADEDLAEIVRMTLELLGDEDVDGAVIISNADQRFLADLGFKVVGGEGIDVDLDGLAGPAVSGAMVRPLTAADAPEVRRIHERSGAGEPLWLRRDAVRWDYLMRAAMVRDPRSGSSPPVQLVSMRGGRISGYAIAAPRGPDLELLDLGLAEPDAASFGALMESLREEGGDHGCTRMSTPILPGAVGKLLRERFRPTPLREGILLAASLGDRFDPEIAIARGGGYAALERS